MSIRHVIKAQQFDKHWIEGFFGQVRLMEDVAASGGSDALRRRIMATLFYQPSTRTRLSFEAAMCRLGGTVISTENAKEFSSAAKGESLEDTIRVVAGYADVIVLRHYELGSSERAAALDAVPVINAGDGPGQHPTQALLDLYTIERELGRLSGLKVAMVGDLKYGRTVRSLAYLLSKFEGTTLYFVAPPICQIGDDIKAHLAEKGVPFSEVGSLDDVIGEADVIYQTRIQKEAFSFEELQGEYEETFRRFIITPELVSRMRQEAIIMHPLPRVKEIATSVDGDRRAAYFRQAKNGLYVRMALLMRILGKEAKA
jgi:aspartate carbamoyltransferase catalytic subunit